MTGSDDTTINEPLLVIVGETASGKSALAIELAEKYNGEIICADSRTVYREMNIGTAKPDELDRWRVPHYGLDLVRPDEPYNVADYKQYAVRMMREIQSRGRLPILVGGTGLYIDAILYDYTFRSPADPEIRSELNKLTVEELQDKLLQMGVALPRNARNPRHLIRSIETKGEQGGSGALRKNTLVLGLAPPREVLESRISQRVDAMIDNGFVQEVEVLSRKYGWDVPAMQAPGYRAFREYIEGTIGLEEAKAQFIKNDLHLAKRQRTWFRRNNSIQWLPTGEELPKSVELITTLLNK